MSSPFLLPHIVYFNVTYITFNGIHLTHIGHCMPRRRSDNVSGCVPFKWFKSEVVTRNWQEESKSTATLAACDFFRSAGSPSISLYMTH
jgi:hypothetical protein